MILRRKQLPDLIIVIIQKDRVVCAALSHHISSTYLLKHYASTPMPLLAITGSLIATTALGNAIARFIAQYRLHTNFISVICDTPLIQDGFATTLHASAQEYLHHNLSVVHTTLNSLYLGPYQHDKFLHWWDRIGYPLILQLHLIAYKHRLNIIRIVSPFPLILETYKKIRSTVFHPLQLISDLEVHQFELANAIDISLMKNFLYHSISAHEIDPRIISALIGAALYEGY